jgi:hypothetical protein
LQSVFLFYDSVVLLLSGFVAVGKYVTT